MIHRQGRNEEFRSGQRTPQDGDNRQRNSYYAPVKIQKMSSYAHIFEQYNQLNILTGVIKGY